MKKLKRTAVILLALAMVLSLSACGSFKTKILKGAKNMQELQSLHADVNADIDLTMDILKQELKLDMLISAGSDIITEPFRMYSEIQSDVMGMGGTAYSYIEKQGDEYICYASDDGEYWESEVLEPDEEPMDIDIPGMISLISKYASSFEEVGEEKILDYDTVRYDGSISSSDIGELIELLGGSEMLEEAAGEQIDVEQALASLGGSFTIPTSIWLDDQSGMLIKYSMDVSEFASDVLSLIMAELVKEMGPELPDMGLKLRIDKTVVEVTLSQFDAIGEIKAPNAA